MNTATRLGMYGAALAVVFGGAYVAADAVVPQSTVTEWTEEAKAHEMSGDSGHGEAAEQGHGDSHGASSPAGAEAHVPGVTSAYGGYLFSGVTAPDAVGRAGKLSFRILDARGDAVTEFVTSHEKKLHLIVVRTDGTRFRHVHPVMAADGTWSLPWKWTAAGTYRAYAEFVPETDGAAEPITLTRTIDVAGEFAPATTVPTRTASVDGYTVELSGDVVVGSSSHLTFTVSRNGRPVTNLQPYLGAFGHLVALREGDLGYLHVHPEGEEPAPGDVSGPEIGFAAEAPTPGRYLLYLDFQVDGEVHSASFVVDTDGSTPAPAEDDQARPTEGSDAESGDGHGHSH